MTYIEFFDKTASENVATCLTYVPERVIYIGDNAKMMKKHIERYSRVFSDRDYDIEFLYKAVSKSNLDNIVELLTELVEEYDNCVFDITGGEEIFLLALGIVYANNIHKNIQIHRFNLRNNKLYDCDMDGTTIYNRVPALSVEENIRIYGGEVVYGDGNVACTKKWDLSEEFESDINKIWSVCKGFGRNWNAVIGMLNTIEYVGNVVSTEPLTTVAKKSDIEEYIARHRYKYKVVDDIIKELIKHNLITSFCDTEEETITISYKDEQVKKCLTLAGQALEMKIYITAKNVLDSDGFPVYNDAINGVVIDWDGEFHDETVEDGYDTENEIDILLMHDVVPVFISCKNGIVTADELYKLNTVAHRFGGKYSKKVLVATAIQSLGEAGNYLRQRAKDMGITIIEDIQYMEDAELEGIIKNLSCN